MKMMGQILDQLTEIYPAIGGEIENYTGEKFVGELDKLTASRYLDEFNKIDGKFNALPDVFALEASQLLARSVHQQQDENHPTL